MLRVFRRRRLSNSIRTGRIEIIVTGLSRVVHANLLRNGPAAADDPPWNIDCRRPPEIGRTQPRTDMMWENRTTDFGNRFCPKQSLANPCSRMLSALFPYARHIPTRPRRTAPSQRHKAERRASPRPRHLQARRVTRCRKHPRLASQARWDATLLLQACLP